MTKHQNTLSDRVILLAERDMSSALDLEDRIVRHGGSVLTAYSTERAVFLASNALLSDAVIHYTFPGLHEIIEALKARRVPYLLLASKQAEEMNPVSGEASGPHPS